MKGVGAFNRKHDARAAQWLGVCMGLNNQMRVCENLEHASYQAVERPCHSGAYGVTS